MEDQKIRIYLDQNILSYAQDGTLNLSPIENVVWVYSNEHFVEMERSNDFRCFAILEKIKAQRIEFNVNQSFQITEEAKIHPYEEINQVYQTYKKATSNIKIDENANFFRAASSRIMGADNFEDVLTSLKNCTTEIKTMFEEIGMPSQITNMLMNEVKSVNDTLFSMIEKNLNKTMPLEELRKAFGTDSGKAVATKGSNIIEEIWQLIKNKNPSLTCDQVFGFEQMTENGFKKVPLNLGITACHAALNMLGYKADRGLSKPTNMSNFQSDGNHLGYASFCHIFLSADTRLCAKAKAIFQYKQIDTRIIKVSFENKTPDVPVPFGGPK